jgi:hypothetical protein
MRDGVLALKTTNKLAAFLIGLGRHRARVHHAQIRLTVIVNGRRRRLQTRAQQFGVVLVGFTAKGLKKNFTGAETGRPTAHAPVSPPKIATPVETRDTGNPTFQKSTWAHAANTEAYSAAAVWVMWEKEKGMPTMIPDNHP